MVELKKIISEDTYNLLSRSSKDPNRYVVNIKRYCFIYEKQSFNLDKFVYPFPGLWILRVDSSGMEIKMPPFLVGKECTDSKDTSSYTLSLKTARNPNTVY